MAGAAGGQGQQQEETLKSFLAKNESIIAKYLAQGAAFDAKHLTTLALQVWARGSEELQACTQLSILDALCEAASLGLEIGSSVLSHAYLVPFNESVKGANNVIRKEMRAHLQVSARGKLELFRRSGLGTHADVREICEGDDCVVELGTNAFIKHSINFQKRRGPPIAYYAVAYFKDGTYQFEAMSLAECLKVRDDYSKGKDGPAWKKSEGEMCKKTVLHRLEKWLPLSPAQQRAHDLDDESTEIVQPGAVSDVTPGAMGSPSGATPAATGARTSPLLAAAQSKAIDLPALRVDERETVSAAAPVSSVASSSVAPLEPARVSPAEPASPAEVSETSTAPAPDEKSASAPPAKADAPAGLDSGAAGATGPGSMAALVKTAEGNVLPPEDAPKKKRSGRNGPSEEQGALKLNIGQCPEISGNKNRCELAANHAGLHKWPSVDAKVAASEPRETEPEPGSEG